MKINGKQWVFFAFINLAWTSKDCKYDPSSNPWMAIPWAEHSTSSHMPHVPKTSQAFPRITRFWNEDPYFLGSMSSMFNFSKFPWVSSFGGRTTFDKVASLPADQVAKRHYRQDRHRRLPPILRCGKTWEKTNLVGWAITSNLPP